MHKSVSVFRGPWPSCLQHRLLSWNTFSPLDCYEVINRCRWLHRSHVNLLYINPNSNKGFWEISRDCLHGFRWTIALSIRNSLAVLRVQLSAFISPSKIVTSPLFLQMRLGSQRRMISSGLWHYFTRLLTSNFVSPLFFADFSFWPRILKYRKDEF